MQRISDAPRRPRRPLADRVEVAAPWLAALVARVLARMPPPVRRRALDAAFARAEDAFNRGDFEAIFALFADDVRYVPPPPLGAGAITGRAAVLSFWQQIAGRFEVNTIRNLGVEELAPQRFVRRARITHRGAGEDLGYAIRQVTELRRGRVVSQVNEQIDTDPAPPHAGRGEGSSISEPAP
jgi:ketosteroid isomerase-like protein